MPRGRAQEKKSETTVEQAAPLPKPSKRPKPTDFKHKVGKVPFVLPLPPREAQAEALAKIIEAFDSGKRFVIFEGPPGVGKSAIAASLALHYKSAYVCTVTKQLQQQYMKDFEAIGCRELKGRASFRCSRANDNCDVGGVLFTGKEACGISDKCPLCPYRTAKQIALDAWLTVCNYQSYLYNIGQGEESDEPGGLKWERPLLILDEGHETESILLDFVGVSINVQSLPVLVPSDPPRTDANGQVPPTELYFNWLQQLQGRLSAVLKDRSLDARETARARRLYLKLCYLFVHRASEEWIVEPTEKGFDMKPLTVSSFGERMFEFGQRVLLMSATILDAERLAVSLGIPLHEYEFVRAPCIFPKENRPIYVGELNMTKAARDESWPMMIEAIANVMGCDGKASGDERYNHAAQKGLILTPSNEMLKYIQKELSGKYPALGRRLKLAFGSNRMQIYEEHLKDRGPSVLCGSGFWEGLDLKDDASRFQIIPACPRPIWQGQIAARAKLDPRWYTWKTLTRLVQGIGRSVRTETDSAVTYVLDKDLRREMHARHTILPPWFTEACVELE